MPDFRFQAIYANTFRFDGGDVLGIYVAVKLRFVKMEFVTLLVIL